VSPAGEWIWKRLERGRCPANWTAYGLFLVRCYSDPSLRGSPRVAGGEVTWGWGLRRQSGAGVVSLSVCLGSSPNSWAGRKMNSPPVSLLGLPLVGSVARPGKGPAHGRTGRNANRPADRPDAHSPNLVCWCRVRFFGCRSSSSPVIASEPSPGTRTSRSCIQPGGGSRKKV
jgi:hypothetical protein